MALITHIYLYTTNCGFGHFEIELASKYTILCFLAHFLPILALVWSFEAKNTSDWLFLEANGLYHQTMDFGYSKIIFAFKIGNSVFCTPFFAHFEHWRPIESKYGLKY